VKQIILSRQAAGLIQEHSTLLDCRRDGDDVALTLEGAEAAVERLRREGAAHRVVDLNLDEIFEAYVTGKPTGWEQAAADRITEVA
jgi:hypothetical protein